MTCPPRIFIAAWLHRNYLAPLRMMNETDRSRILGYCTNVHAGTDLPQIRENLLTYSQPVRTSVGLEQLGVGLWLPANAASEIRRDVAGFGDFLSARGLIPYTINGFPYDNFHGDVVKHAVYEPAWWDPQRLAYTIELAEILARLLPDEPTTDAAATGSISTLPIGWPTSGDQPLARRIEMAGENFRTLATELARIESTTGRRITVAIEPEPGCILSRSGDAVEFFQQHLPDKIHRRHLSVCHDVCHASVMFETQSDAINRYTAADIEIGKLQISSGIVGSWESMAAGRRDEALSHLHQFAEDRYLHQTGRLTANDQFVLAEDLPELLRGASQPITTADDKTWVVHFHVPIFLERFGNLTTTRDDIPRCLRAIRDAGPNLQFTGHIEIETYAWSVLPESMRRRSLVEDIADEVRWLRTLLLSIEA